MFKILIVVVCAGAGGTSSAVVEFDNREDAVTAVRQANKIPYTTAVTLFEDYGR